MTAPPELLYLLAGDPVEFAQVVAGMRSADIAEALRDLPPSAAARVITARLAHRVHASVHPPALRI